MGKSYRKHNGNGILISILWRLIGNIMGYVWIYNHQYEEFHNIATPQPAIMGQQPQHRNHDKHGDLMVIS